MGDKDKQIYDIIKTNPTARHFIYKKINEYLIKNFPSNYNCLSDRTLGKVFTNFKRIGTPSVYGSIYSACITKYVLTNSHIDSQDCLDICKDMVNFDKNITELCKKDTKKVPLKVSIKFQKLTDEEVDDTSQSISSGSIPWNMDKIYNKENLFKEIRTTYLLHYLLSYGICPNIPYIYRVFLCDKKCKIEENKIKMEQNYFHEILTDMRTLGHYTEKVSCAIIINELAYGDLKSWCKTKKTSKEWICMYLQLFLALIGIQYNFDFVHNDFHWGNQLYSTINKKELWSYEVYNAANIYKYSCLVPTNGYLFKIWDLGFITSEFMTDEMFPHDKGDYLIDVFRILHAPIWALMSPEHPTPPTNILKWSKNVIQSINSYISNHPTQRLNLDVLTNLITRVFDHYYLKEFGIEGDFIYHKDKHDDLIKRKFKVTKHWKIYTDKNIRKNIKKEFKKL